MKDGAFKPGHLARGGPVVLKQNRESISKAGRKYQAIERMKRQGPVKLDWNVKN